MLQSTLINSTRFTAESPKVLIDGMLFQSMKENNTNGKNLLLTFTIPLFSKKPP